MPSTKRKPGNQRQNGSVPETSNSFVDPSIEVLTVSEAAAYLRVAVEEVLSLAQRHELPGRQIGSEWRFLKAGLQDWLRTSTQRSGKEAMLALAGVWKGDPDIESIVQEAHRRRGRPIPENEE
jgi:excisionase family DNA binding protein